MLKMEQVSARYETVSGYVNSVDNVSFEVRKNEIMGIAGESGCGKSTLLKTMYDLVDFPLEHQQRESYPDHRVLKRKEGFDNRGDQK